MNLISVIIPIYNDEKYLSIAVNSVLKQNQVGEIILVDDGSTDGSFEIALDWQKKHPDLIRVLFHENHVNLGAAVTRNLGIVSSRFDWLAFLDADDFYLENRFENAIQILKNDATIDGVYEAIGTHFYDEEGRQLHLRRMKEINISELKNELTTLTRKVEPEVLFEELLIGGIGWFHFNGLTVRKSIFEKTGLLDPFMRYGQDTELFMRMAMHARLVPGELDKPVAKRGVYSGNSTLSVFTSKSRSSKNDYYNAYMWKKAFGWALNNQFGKETNRYLFFRYVDHYDKFILKSPIGFRRKIYKLLICIGILLENPRFIGKIW